MKKLEIRQLKEGFLFTDENDDDYAVSSGSLSKKVLAYFGLTRHDSRKKTEIKKTAKQPLDKCNCITPRSPMPVLHPSDLKIAKFDYDNNRMQRYKTLKFLELPDGRVVLQYANSRYYTEREKVMQIPYPFLRGHFSKENGWSSNVEQAVKMYRRCLAERKEPEGQPDGTCDDVSFDTCANNDPETCKFCVDGSRYEDKQKIAAKNPGRLC